MRSLITLNLLTVKAFVCINSLMKKHLSLTIRIDEEMNSQIRKIAESDERTMGWMARKLIAEALHARGVKPSSK